MLKPTSRFCATCSSHQYIMTAWHANKRIPHLCPFVRRIQQSLMDSSHEWTVIQIYFCFFFYLTEHETWNSEFASNCFEMLWVLCDVSVMPDNSWYTQLFIDYCNWYETPLADLCLYTAVMYLWWLWNIAMAWLQYVHYLCTTDTVYLS